MAQGSTESFRTPLHLTHEQGHMIKVLQLCRLEAAQDEPLVSSRSTAPF
jgi:hypothetical protein